MGSVLLGEVGPQRQGGGCQVVHLQTGQNFPIYVCQDLKTGKLVLMSCVFPVPPLLKHSVTIFLTDCSHSGRF